MKLSFIIPLYNEEKTIRECMESLIAQMYDNDEIIVVDNGSTDNSISIVTSFPNIKIIIKPNATIGALRNLGAAIANNDVLAFIDADCVLCRNWRENVIITLNNRVVASGCKYDIPIDSVWIERAWYSQQNAQCTPVNYINSGNLVIWKDVFDKVNGFSETLKTGEDSELGWRINKAGYTILSNPEIRAIHLGNPKNLKNFYMKQKWHALGMLGTFKISYYDKPLIMTIMYTACNLLAILAFVFWTLRGNFDYGILAFLALTLCVPVVTTFYRTMQYNNIRYFFHLVCLYWVYFFARTNVLLLMGFNKIRTR